MARQKKEAAQPAPAEPTIEVVDVLTAADEAENQNQLKIVIENAVKQYNIVDATIAEMKQRLTARVTSVEDKESFALVKAQLSEVRQLRYDVENKRKLLNRNAIDYKNAVDTEAKRITELLLEIETPLKENKEWFEIEKARLKAEQEQAAHVKFVSRTTYLLERGFSFNGSMYVLDTLHVTTNQIREFDEPQWNEVAARAEALHLQRIEAQKRAEAEAQAAQQAQQAEMAAMIQERYETRAAWLQGRGFVLNSTAEGGVWYHPTGTIPVVGVRDWTKEAWQEAARKVVAAQVAQAPQGVVSIPEPVKPQTVVMTPQPTSQPTNIFAQKNAAMEAAPADFVAPTGGELTHAVVETSGEPHLLVRSRAEVYAEGFRSCQALIITKFHDGQQRTRAQWIELITNLKPEV